jgi:hypothetical protein
VLPYTVIPTFREQAGYAELKRVLNPRWCVAGCVGYTSANASGKVQSYEGAAGFRPNRFQLIKIDYELQHYSVGPYFNARTGCINPVRNQEDIPQGLKPAVLLVFCGTTEVVPFQSLFMQPVLAIQYVTTLHLGIARNKYRDCVGSWFPRSPKTRDLGHPGS